MRNIRLGISIYPEFAAERDCLDYLARAAERGFSVLFIALLGVTGERWEVVARYKTLTDEAHRLGFEVCCDVNPSVLKRFGVNASVFAGKLDLSFLQEIGADIMRLDQGLSEMEEAFLTRNVEGLRVCLNAASNEFDHIGAMLASGGEPSRVVGCHNFYPHRYTGLPLDYFMQCSRFWNDRGLTLQAFVTSQMESAFGPWPVSDGMPTLEMHRDLPVSAQARHLALLDCVDDIIVGNCFASDEELSAIAEGIADPTRFTVHAVEGLPDELARRLGIKFSCRPEKCDYLIRTIESRMFKGDVESFNVVDIKRGDVLVDNNDYGQYAGEVQIARVAMPNSGRTNVVGRIDESELMLLDNIKAGTRFSFKLV